MARRTAAMVVSGSIAAVLVVVASAAWACTAFLQLSGPPEATVGTLANVRAVGSYPNNEYALRWNGATGPVVATVRSDAIGAFNATYTVPETAPGLYFVLVMRSDNTTLGRMAVQVRPGFDGATAPAAAAPAPVLSTGSASVPSTAGSSGFPWALGMLYVVAGVAVAGTAFATVTVMAGQRATARAGASRGNARSL